MSYQFKVGDKVQRIGRYREVLGWPHGDKVVEVLSITGSGALVFDNEWTGGWDAERFHLVQSFSEQGKARANDPDTSKKAARKPRAGIKHDVYALVQTFADGVTGHEAAKILDKPLNSVTPRFAELRREEKIKDSGQRRDGQIVWVLA